MACGPEGVAPSPPPAALPSPSPSALGEHLGQYRTWKALVADPRPVPPELWARCVPAPGADGEKARETHGRHTQRFIRVYANAFAVDGLARHPPMLPVGAVIVKEKLFNATDAVPVGSPRW